MDAVYAVIVLAAAIVIYRTAFGKGRALQRRVADAEGASGSAEELLAGGGYERFDCGFEMKRPDKFSAQVFTSVHVGENAVVLVERGVGYRVDREGAAVKVTQGRLGRRIVIDSPQFEARLFPVDADAFLETLRSAGWVR